MREFSDQCLAQHPLAQQKTPSGWLRLSLANIGCEVTSGFASGAHTSDGIGVAHLRPMNVDRDGKINLDVVKFVAATGGKELAGGDVLFNNTNSPELIGKTAVVSMREAGFAYSNHMTRIRTPSGTSSVYLAHQLHFLWLTGYMKHRCTNHVNQASLSSKALAETVPFLLPPEAEQTRIADKLDELLSELDAGVAELKAAQKKIAQYRQSLLKSAVEGRLTEVWRAEHGEPEESGAQLLERILRERRTRWEAKQLAKFEAQRNTPPDDWQKKYQPALLSTSGDEQLPAGWVLATIEQLADVGTGVTPLRSSARYFENGTVPWVTSGALNDENIKVAKERVTELAIKECRLALFPTGSLLVAMYGEGKTRGKCAELLFPATINQAIAALVFHSAANACKAYVKTFLLKSYELMREQASGGVQPNLNLQIIKSIALPLPPLTEQAEIAFLVSERFEQLKIQADAVQRSLRQSAAQRKNILQAAFSGQLVPQDPNDEPASVLLDRIRAERATRAKPSSTPRKPRKVAKEAA